MGSKRKMKKRMKKKSKRSGITKHKKIRPTCRKCGRHHSTSSHRFHGRGSYARTHG